jgi:23S rRNA (cytidine1920-2'-O)/16S rRNA (cytidine1409-2'-O)-methyltransferase
MRLDQYLQKTSRFKSREKAKEAIETGLVLINGSPQKKSSYNVKEDDEIQIKEEKIFVSRSGNKLKSAVERFKVNVKDSTCLDVGSSTGGFTQYLLESGAKKIYAVDVGTNQMEVEISSNEKVCLNENTDIRDFKKPKEVNFDLIVVDVSFISLSKIIEKLKELSNESTVLMLLFKPQFEVGKEYLKKGICKHPDLKLVIESFREKLSENKFFLDGVMKVPLKGKEGNQEYFLKVACHT